MSNGSLGSMRLMAVGGAVTALVLVGAGVGSAVAGPDQPALRTAASTGQHRAATPISTRSSFAGPAGHRYVAGQVIVGYRQGATTHARSAVVREVRAHHTRGLGVRSTLLHVRRGRVKATIARLRKSRSVRYAEPNFVIHDAGVPNDADFNREWGLWNTGQKVENSSTPGKQGADISATQAWSIATSTHPVVIGEVDSGVDYTHPDLAANIWRNPGGLGGCPAGTHGYNVVAGNCAPQDDYNHGTFVAGVMGAVGNNGQGVTGVAWKTSILPVKYIHQQGWGTVAELIQGLNWIVAAKQAGVDVRVVNDSGTWTSWTFSQSLKDELGRLADNDILFVTAAGNTQQDNDTTPRYPCDYDAPNEICVAATNQWDDLAWFSNYGATTVDLAAPGQSIYSTLPGGKYGYWSGASFSSAYVAGAAALVQGHCPALSVTQLKADIVQSVDPDSALHGKVVSGGRLDLYQAMKGCGP